MGIRSAANINSEGNPIAKEKRPKLVVIDMGMRKIVRAMKARLEVKKSTLPTVTGMMRKHSWRMKVSSCHIPKDKASI